MYLEGNACILTINPTDGQCPGRLLLGMSWIQEPSGFMSNWLVTCCVSLEQSFLLTLI